MLATTRRCPVDNPITDRPLELSLEDSVSGCPSRLRRATDSRPRGGARDSRQFQGLDGVDGDGSSVQLLVNTKRSSEIVGPHRRGEPAGRRTDRRPRQRRLLRSTNAPRPNRTEPIHRRTHMRITLTNVIVDDQAKALAFYTRSSDSRSITTCPSGTTPGSPWSLQSNLMDQSCSLNPPHTPPPRHSAMPSPPTGSQQHSSPSMTSMPNTRGFAPPGSSSPSHPPTSEPLCRPS